MTRSRLEPLFIETSVGLIFLLLRAPPTAEHCVLFVPPFGEEMNKCRRQVAETAQLLVRAGHAVLYLDLFGTGDSEGAFEEATWTLWRDNVIAAIGWSEEQGLPIDSVVATRLGCALAAEALKEARHSVRCTAFWQPVENGRQFMTQFLRLRIAASMMQDGDKETVERIKARLARGEAVEVSGYFLNGELWRGVEQLELSSLLDPRLGHLAIWEVGRDAEGELSAPGKRLQHRALERGVHVTADRLAGEPFWSSTEVVTHHELAAQTARFISADASR